MKNILSLLEGYQKRKLVSVIILALLLSISELLSFYFLQPIINYFTGNINLNNLAYFKSLLNIKLLNIANIVCIFIFLFLSRCAFTLLLSYKRTQLIRSVNDNLSKKLYSNYLNKDFEFFLNNNSSNLISNIINKVDDFSYNVIQSIIFLITDCLIVIAITAFLLITYFKETIIFFLFFSFFYAFIYIFCKKKFIKLGNERVLAESSKIEDLQKSFYVIQNIKLDRLEKFFEKKFIKNTNIASKNRFYLDFISDVPKPLAEAVIILAIFLLMYIFFFYFHQGKELIVSMLGVFTVAMFRVLPLNSRVLNSLNAIKYFKTTVNDIKAELHDNKNTVDKYDQSKNSQDKYPFKDNFFLENINFSYSRSNKKVLENINLKINNNSITGIYGDSGSGKSTLLNIIACLLKPSSGRMYIDGKLLESDYRDFQNNIGYVTQKVYLTDESLIKNIAFGKNETDYDKKLLLEVIFKSNLTDVVKKLPEGIDTILGERGSKLSGGQQQKIGIARVLYKKPKIIIFDEATNALDIDSETEILKTIQSLKKETAILIVSHKILFQDYCDSVYKFQDNKLIKIK